MVILDILQTEQRDLATADLDYLSTTELLQLMNQRDDAVLEAVAKCIPQIANAIETLCPKIGAGGRLVYIGAGTSGRLGIVDAAEVPPTFSASADQFVAIIAGGDAAIRVAQEGAEDKPELAVQDLERLHLTPLDSLIGIAASGRTPYVIGGLEYAHSQGCFTIGLACVSPACLPADVLIEAVPGPELITGSTRLKAGTATKLVLNMISTGVMIKIGKTFGNLMVDLNPTNLKLRARSKLIFRTICSPSSFPQYNDDAALERHFANCGGNIKLAILTAQCGIPVDQAEQVLNTCHGALKRAIDMVQNKNKQVVDSAAAIESASSSSKLKDLVVAVDGGGSKTAAVITTKSGQIFRGVAGPSSVTTNSIPQVIAAISTAITAALTQLDGTGTNPDEHYFGRRFNKVWIGLAGAISCSPKILEELTSKLESLFNLSGSDLKITGDATLLAGALQDTGELNKGITTCATLIAGTGSSSMVFEATNGVGNSIEYKFLGKTGGWGPILGDDAGGYGMGLCAIKKTLAALDQTRITGGNYNENLTTLHKSVIKAFDSDYDGFLSCILKFLSSDEKGSSNNSSKTSKVASLTRLVFDAAYADPPDQAAAEIVNQATEDVMQYLRSILEAGIIRADSSLLVLGGSVFLRAEYRDLVIQKLKASGVTFHRVVSVADVAEMASRVLARLKL